ncbi:Rieske 2Fe-2S domain-containing protein [Rhodococcoides yunnanense]|uniref:Rieske 2Fe-2S domain-containing protein n=1 Tax=Rhodococcoides yunnanense TaxID=278209 RepID=UPI000A0213C2|nr:Rieske 2Fe-2S domain-containing protein [Rhodococcus yunnanensis]
MTATSQDYVAESASVATGPATASRIKLHPFPVGWYRIASSEDVKAGELVSMRWFGEDLICWRSADGGEPRVFDAYCAHMGANIGRGGFVQGDTVVCPFHHWKYDCAGKNVEIPYRDKPQRGARQKVWTAIERNGQILVWNAPDGSEPDWTPPQLPEATDPEFVSIVSEKIWTVRTHVQEVFENTVDVSHFQFVHGVAGFGSVELVEDGPMFRATASVSMETSRGKVDGAVESELWGLGLDIVRQVGIGRARSIFSVTPIDDEQVVATHTFFVPGDADGPSRYGKAFMREFSRQIEQDIPIWETKLYRAKPRLATGENAILDFRRWATQFYAADDE